MYNMTNLWLSFPMSFEKDVRSMQLRVSHEINVTNTFLKVTLPCLSPQDLGSSAGSKRPTCVIMIKSHEDYKEAYDECFEEVSALPKPL